MTITVFFKLKNESIWAAIGSIVYDMASRVQLFISILWPLKKRGIKF